MNLNLQSVRSICVVGFICIVCIFLFESFVPKISKFMCTPPANPIRNMGRVESEFPSPRCCVDAGCLDIDKGRYAVLTTLRTDKYLTLLRNLACSMKRANPAVELLVATVRGDLLEKTENDVRSLGAKLIYWENFELDNYRSKRFQLNWVKVRAWEMEQYDALLMIDSDTVVLENIQHLFKIPAHFASVLDEDKAGFVYNSLGRLQGGVIFLRPCPAISSHMIDILGKNSNLHFADAHAEQSFFDWYFRYERWSLPGKIMLACWHVGITCCGAL